MTSASTTRFLQRHPRLFAVLGGGLIGSALRTGVAELVQWDGRGWPIATLVVNVAGAAALGWYLARSATRGRTFGSVVFWATGMLGSLTTFSALSLEVVLMLDAGRGAAAAGYALTSTLLGVGAAAAGDALGHRRW